MKITLIGTVSRLGAEKQFGDFRRREVVVAEGGDEARPIPVEFSAGAHGPDRVLPTLGLSPGDLVRVEAILSGREWEGRVYLRLCGLSIAKAAFEDPASSLPPPSEFPPKGAENAPEVPF